LEPSFKPVQREKQSKVGGVSSAAERQPYSDHTTSLDSKATKLNAQRIMPLGHSLFGSFLVETFDRLEFQALASKAAKFGAPHSLAIDYTAL